MKILAIRGSNLASLASEFAIELEQDPLAQAGLFAITGPTGAGKSTLLDALCVALFDRTPRLHERGGAPIGRADQDEKDRLPAHDVRGLLRRGCGEGHAEVDFLGRDQRVYRARWEVRRARRKPDGRMQLQEMSLADLATGKNLSGTRTETLQEIEARLGLSFEQFRRSALLAQGDFAAFLRADERARGELLERMTGTQIYSELSRAAFEQHKREAGELLHLEEAVARHAVLDHAEREALEAERQAAEARVAGCRAAVQEAEAAMEWHRRRDELLADEGAAREELARAEQAWAGAASLREQRAALARALELEPVVRAAERSERAWAEASAALAGCEGRAGACEQAAEAARDRARQAEVGLAAARAAREQAAPALAEAARLDAEIDLGARDADRARGARDQAAALAEKVEREHARLVRDMAAHEARATRAEAWLAQRPYLAAVAGAWPRWQSTLDRYVRSARERDELAGQRADLVPARDAAEAALERARARTGRFRQARDAARARAEAAQRAADAMPVDGVRRERDGLAARREDLRALATAADRARAALAALDQARAEAERTTREQAEADAEAEGLGHEIEQAGAALAEAERGLGNLRLALDLGAHRQRLRDGEPCPLCGSAEHPFRRGSVPAQDLGQPDVIPGRSHGTAGAGRVDDIANREPGAGAHAGHPDAAPGAEPEAAIARLLAQAEERVQGLRARRDAARERRADARARARAAGTRGDGAERQRAAAADTLGEARQAWSRSLRALGELALLPDPASPAAAEGIATRLAAADAQMAALAERERKAGSLAESARRASGLAAARESDLEQAEVALGEREQAARAAREALARCDQERGRLAGIEDQAAGELAQAFAGDAACAGRWRAQLDSDPAGFCSAWRAAVEGWLRRSRLRDQARSALERLGAELGHVDERAREARESADRARAAHAGQEAALAALRERRAALFAGQATAGVRARLDGAVARAEEAARAAREERERTGQAAAELRARAHALRAEHERAQEERARAGAALERALGQAGMRLDQARKLLDRGRERLAACDAEIAALEQALARATVIDAERRAQRARFEAQDAPSLERAAAEPALDRSRQALQAAQDALAELQVKMRLDDDARRHRSEISGKLRAQMTRARLYESLSELIGSADGKKFRVFAQSLTLDMLLAHANAHLEDLAPRYRLVRVPGHDLDLQVVDRDMGDEIRSVNSLSGGESFLVSLALALALSSLSARDTRVESLLIDEGFGSLDPGTFEVALSVLDALQASGRKVGVISHVPGLAERIGVCVAVRPQGAGRSVVRVMER